MLTHPVFLGLRWVGLCCIKGEGCLEERLMPTARVQCTLYRCGSNEIGVAFIEYYVATWGLMHVDSPVFLGLHWLCWVGLCCIRGEGCLGKEINGISTPTARV